MTQGRIPFRAVHVVLLATLLGTCGGGSNTPTTPPTPTPAPSAPTQPTPPPTPAPPVGLGRCTLPAVSGEVRECPRRTPSFLNEVDQAINRLAAEEPEIFNFGDAVGPNGWRVLSVGRYYTGVLRNLETMGLCATFDGEEVQVKNTNDFNDQYHIMISSGHVRRGDVTYRATCFPAAFPRAEPPLAQRGDCALPSSRHLACGRDPVPFLYGDYQAALAATRQERPDLFRADDVLDVNAFYRVFIEKLRARGLCAWGPDQGAEVQIKRTNVGSAHYHPVLSFGRLRTDEFAYRSSCYPAAF